MIRRTLLLLMALILTFTSSGCWGKKELNEISILVLTGVDLEPTGEVRVTNMTLNPVGSSTGEQNRSLTRISSVVGKTFAAATEKFWSIDSQYPLLSHTSVIIVGEKAAESILPEIIDIHMRFREFRYSTYLLVTEGRALDLMQVPPEIDKNLAVKIQGLAQNAPGLSRTLATTLKDVAIAASSPYQAIITGKLGFFKTSRITFSTPREELEKIYWKDEPLGIAFMEGSAVIKGNKLQGWMDGNETRGYLWITGEVKTGEVLPAGMEESKAALLIRSAKEKTSVFLTEDNRVSIHVKLDVSGVVSEQTKENMYDENVARQFEKAFSETITAEMASALKKAQQAYNADIFGFSEDIRRKYPQRWKALQQDWDRIFPRVQVSFEVSTTILNTQKLTRIID